MKIAIVKLSAMGDIIHTMVVLQFIKKNISNIQIDWIVEKSFQAILQNNPHINKILPIELKSIKKNKLNIINQIKLLNIYAKNNYDIVIDAQGLIKSAIVSKILGNRVVGSFIAGFDKNSIRESFASIFYDKTISIGYEKNVIDRNITLFNKILNLNITKDDILNKTAFLYTNAKLTLPKFDIIFIIGASKINKIYPKEKFLEIAQKLKHKTILVVWGNTEEYETALWLSNNSSNIILDKKGNIEELKYKIKYAKLVIGADTGPTHIAWGLNIPSITIFGNTPEYRNTYLTHINKVVKSNSIVDPLKLDKNDFSIKDIDPNKIVNIANELLL